MSQNQTSMPARITRFLLAATFLLVSSVGTTLFVMNYYGPGRLAAGDSPEASSDNQAGPQPIFSGLEPFTVTLNSEHRSRVLYVAITLRLDDQVSAELIQSYTPTVRDRALRLLAEQDPDHIQTRDGRAALAAELGRVLGAAYSPASRSPKISDVLFTAFVVQ